MLQNVIAPLCCFHALAKWCMNILLRWSNAGMDPFGSCPNHCCAGSVSVVEKKRHLIPPDSLCKRAVFSNLHKWSYGSEVPPYLNVMDWKPCGTSSSMTSTVNGIPRASDGPWLVRPFFRCLSPGPLVGEDNIWFSSVTPPSAISLATIGAFRFSFGVGLISIGVLAGVTCDIASMRSVRSSVTDSWIVGSCVSDTIPNPGNTLLIMGVRGVFSGTLDDPPLSPVFSAKRAYKFFAMQYVLLIFLLLFFYTLLLHPPFF